MVMVFCKEETFPSPCAPLITDTPLCLATNRDCPVSCTYLSILGSQHRQVRHAFTTSIQAKRQTPNTKNQKPNTQSHLNPHPSPQVNPQPKSQPILASNLLAQLQGQPPMLSAISISPISHPRSRQHHLTKKSTH